MKERSALSNKKYATKQPIAIDEHINNISLEKEGLLLIYKTKKPTNISVKLNSKDGFITFFIYEEILNSICFFKSYMQYIQYNMLAIRVIINGITGSLYIFSNK